MMLALIYSKLYIFLLHYIGPCMKEAFQLMSLIDLRREYQKSQSTYEKMLNFISHQEKKKSAN